MTGKFITFEGGEGVGKTTNIRLCAEWLEQQGITVVLTREPGGTPIAEEIRERLLKAHHPESMDPLAELLLMFAARAQHLERLIKPALARGEWVLCDRFTDSTLAYQGYGRGLPEATIFQLKTLVQGDLEPDLTLLLDAPLETGSRRASQRGEAIDRFESEQQSFFQRVREGFLALSEQHERFAVVDADRPLDLVKQDVLVRLESLLKDSVRG